MRTFFPVFASLFLFTLSASRGDVPKQKIPTWVQKIVLKKNTHLIDENTETGFKIYRSGKPLKDAYLKELCDAGVSEIMVLDGSGALDIEVAKRVCPNKLKVINVTDQLAPIALTDSFLAAFDAWVEKAQRNGTKIAFRCSCGCHRTGRLAAYYGMKYQGLSAESATALMNKYGRFMVTKPMLPFQVIALKEFIDGNPCSQEGIHCVTKNAAAPAITELN